MKAINGNSHAGGFRVFSTNGGPHAPEMVAEMSMHNLVADDANPLKSAEVRQSLVDLYAQAQRTIRLMFKHAPDSEVRRCVNQILVRDFATALDIELQFHKE
jgi:hypothetical protein